MYKTHTRHKLQFPQKIKFLPPPLEWQNLGVSTFTNVHQHQPFSYNHLLNCVWKIAHTDHTHVASCNIIQISEKRTQNTDHNAMQNMKKCIKQDKRKPFAFLLYLSSLREYLCLGRLVGLLTTDYVQQHPISFSSSSHFILSQLMMIWYGIIPNPKFLLNMLVSSIDDRSNSKLHMS